MGNFGFGGYDHGQYGGYQANAPYGGYHDNAPYGGAGYDGCSGGYPYAVSGYRDGHGFALIVVLFILLIIVGAAFVC
jgi:uncharacterized protein (TIGR01732 family)